MISKISPLPEFLVDRYKDWKLKKYINQSEKFKRLAIQGQTPSSLIISCCDSRVQATSIFGSDEGEFFIHRNIANLVPKYSQNSKHSATLAAIEYAIKILKVRYIIILGHTGCGGIEASYNTNIKNISSDLVFVNEWLKIILPAFKNISKNYSPEKQIMKLEEESIKNSLENLLSFPKIKQDVEAGKLSIHGLIHDIGSGNLKYLNPITEKFENI